MKNSSTTDLKWLPPADEWDFRGIEPDECRCACLWEYYRSLPKMDPRQPDVVVAWFKEWMKLGKNLRARHCIGVRARDLSKPYLEIDRTVYRAFSVKDISNPVALVEKLTKQADPVSEYLWTQMAESTRRQLANFHLSNQQALSNLVADIKKVLQSDEFFDETRFARVSLENRTHLLNRKIREDLEWLTPVWPKERRRRNRWLLEEAYPNEIVRYRPYEPLDWRSIDPYYGRAISMQPIKRIKDELKEKIADEWEPIEAIDHCLKDHYFIFSARFSRSGTEKIIADFGKLIRKEAKKHPRSPRAKAANPPYDELNWLAVYRLDTARRKAGLTISAAQQALKTYTNKTPRTDSHTDLPIYAGEAGWSKARSDAQRLMVLLESHPVEFEKKILY
jgi:hypothetical protein